MNYYLLENGKEVGPFDLLTMIKKVRNGKIRPNDRVFVEGREDPLLAMSMPELASYFSEIPQSMEPEAPQEMPSYAPRPDPYAPPPDPARPAPRPQPQQKQQSSAQSEASPVQDVVGDLNIKERLKDAWVFFGDNQTVSVVAGGMAVCGIAANVFFTLIFPAFIGAMLACATAVLLLFVLMIFMQRRVLNEDASPDFFRQLFTVRGVDLVLAAIAASLPIGIPAALGAMVHPIAYLLMLPGALGVSLFVFAPMLIAENLNFRAPDALRYSKDWMRAQGNSALMQMTMLLGSNLLAAACLFVPVFVSLPLSAIIITDIFRDHIAPRLPK